MNIPYKRNACERIQQRSKHGHSHSKDVSTKLKACVLRSAKTKGWFEMGRRGLRNREERIEEEIRGATAPRNRVIPSLPVISDICISPAARHCFKPWRRRKKRFTCEWACASGDASRNWRFLVNKNCLWTMQMPERERGSWAGCKVAAADRRILAYFYIPGFAGIFA